MNIYTELLVDISGCCALLQYACPSRQILHEAFVKSQAVSSRDVKPLFKS